MPTTYRPYSPGQQRLLPQDPKEWIKSGDLSHYVNDLVDQMDLSAFTAVYDGDGRRNQPYHPAMMLKVLILGYATGVYSSRKLEQKMERDVAFRMLAAENFPSYRTLSRFRKQHLAEFKNLFLQVLRLAREMGSAEFGKLAIDGTKIRANASKRKAMSYEYMERADARLEGQIEELVEEARRVDEQEEEDSTGSAGRSGLSKEISIRENRQKHIKAAKQRLESRQQAADDARGRKPGETRNPKGGSEYKRAYGVPDPKAQSNFTDPESRIMKTSTEGFQQCYNAQLAVDGKRQLVVAAAVGQNGSDQGELVPMLDQVEEDFQVRPDAVLADAGYCNERDLSILEDRGIDGYVALGREGKSSKDASTESRPATQRMGCKLATANGKAQYAKRKWMAEAPIGWIKESMGFRRFSFRGLEQVQQEFLLVCLALNIRRMNPSLDSG